jgi:DNA-binding transcriptional LysR family regulator
MELYQIRSFVRVARTGNLTRASEELNLTQPAVSQQIKALETDLGELLFERTGRRLLLTPAGRHLLERAEEILELTECARAEIDALGGLKKGAVHIGTNDSNCLYVLPEVIAEYRKEFPGITIQLANSHSSQVARWVEEGSVEIGVVTLPVAGTGLAATKLFDREDVLICEPDHPLATMSDPGPANLVQYPLLLLDRGSVSHARLREALTSVDQAPGPIMQVGSVDVIKRYVEIGLGVSVVPRINVEHEIGSGRLYARSLDWLPRLAVGVVRRSAGYLSPATREFVSRLERYAIERLGYPPTA